MHGYEMSLDIINYISDTDEPGHSVWMTQSNCRAGIHVLKAVAGMDC
jgi:hypothetical protein